MDKTGELRGLKYKLSLTGWMVGEKVSVGFRLQKVRFVVLIDTLALFFIA